MQLAKNGQIGNICQANALLTLKEYSEDYGDMEFQEMADKLIDAELKNIPNPKVEQKAQCYLSEIEHGHRDFRF